MLGGHTIEKVQYIINVYNFGFWSLTNMFLWGLTICLYVLAACWLLKIIWNIPRMLHQPAFIDLAQMDKYLSISEGEFECDSSNFEDWSLKIYMKIQSTGQQTACSSQGSKSSILIFIRFLLRISPCALGNLRGKAFKNLHQWAWWTDVALKIKGLGVCGPLTYGGCTLA